MNKTFEHEMRTLLYKEREDLFKELASISTPIKEAHNPEERIATFPNYGDDPLNANSESPSEVADFSVNTDITGTLEEKLRAVDSALERLDNNTYGVCQQCGKNISEDRLRANPAAEVCMDCMSV